MHLSERPILRLVFVSVMYLAQGLPWGFVSVALVAYLASQGVTTAQIGWVSGMAMLPWSVKWMWGPVIDRFGIPSMGRRRPWIILAQALMAATTLALVLLPELTANLWMLGVMLLVHNVFVSLQDVSVDALVVEMLGDGERERASGIMYGTSYVGSFLGGAGLGVVVGRWGLHPALITLLGAQLTILAFPILLRERRGEKLLPWTRGQCLREVAEADITSIGQLLQRVVRAFSLRATQLAAVLALLVLIGSTLVSVLAATYIIQEVGWSQERYSAVMGSGGVLLGLVGSLAGGFLAGRFGARRMACLGSGALGLTWMAFGLALHPGMHAVSIAAYAYIEVIFLSFLSVSLFAVFMRVSWPVVAATQFTAYMAMLNVSRAGGAFLAGHAAEHVTTPQAFLLAGIFQVAVIAIVLAIDTSQTRRVLGEMAPSDPADSGNPLPIEPCLGAEIEGALLAAEPSAEP